MENHDQQSQSQSQSQSATTATTATAATTATTAIKSTPFSYHPPEWVQQTISTAHSLQSKVMNGPESYQHISQNYHYTLTLFIKYY